MAEKPEIVVGAHVRHVFSGWTGEVAEIREDDTGMRGAQGPLVRVTVVRAGTRQQWRDITVTRDELEVIADAE